MSTVKTRIIILCVLVFTILQSFGQKTETIKDYFIPIEGKNKAVFYNPDINDEKTTIFYVNQVDSFGIIKIFATHGNVASIQLMTIKFTKNEVRMASSDVTPPIGRNEKESYPVPRIILKLPQIGETLSWTAKDISGDSVQYKASRIIVTINGEQRSAIKLIIMNRGFPDAITIDTYVKGIGYWKSEIMGEQKTNTLDQFDELGYEPNVHMPLK